MKNVDEIKLHVKELIVEVMEDEDLTIDKIQDDTPFFGTEEEPGIIQDSLAILEIATRLGEEYDIMPEDFDEEVFTDAGTLGEFIFKQVNVNA